MPNTTPLTWLLLEAMRTQLQTIRISNGCRTNVGLNVTLELEQSQRADAPNAAIRFVSWERGDVELLSTPARKCEVVVQVTIAANVTNAQRTAHNALEDVQDVFRIQAQVAISATAAAVVLATGASILDRPSAHDAIVGEVRFEANIIEF